MKPEILPPWEGKHKPGGNEYMVVTTTYPTTYGQNSHLTRSQQHFIRACNVDVIGPDGKPDPDPNAKGFDEYADAVELARRVRDENEWFTDHNYKDDDDAPFDSADLKNTDNDEEVLIEVMTKTDFGIKMQSHMKAMFGTIPESLDDAIERLGKADADYQASDDDTRKRFQDKARKEKDDFLAGLLVQLKSDVGKATVKMSFGRYRFGKEEMIQIVNSLKAYANLRQLHISWEYVTVPAMEVLGEFIGEHKHLECLILRDNTIYDDLLVPIAQGIGKNASLLIVDLKDNNFDKAGGVALADALKINKTLKILDLHNNYIYNDSAKALADALKVNETLESLTLTRNGVGEKGYRDFASALSTNNTLKKLDLHYFEFGKTGMLLEMLVKYNKMDISEDERKKLKDGAEKKIGEMSEDELMRHRTLSYMGGM